MAANSAATGSETPRARAKRKVPQATNEPTMAIEKTLAPSVVMPPCPSSSAWNASTIVPTRTITHGPNKTAPRPIPVGCDELPVTDGSLSAERTKQKPPAAPSSSNAERFSAIVFLVLRTLWMTAGAAAAVQTAAYTGGR